MVGCDSNGVPIQGICNRLQVADGRYSANEWVYDVIRCQRGCPVLRRGGIGQMLVSRCAMQSRLSPARCRFARWSRRSVAGGVASMGGSPTRHVIVATMSPRPVVGEIPVKAVYPVVPVELKRPSAL